MEMMQKLKGIAGCAIVVMVVMTAINLVINGMSAPLAFQLAAYGATGAVLGTVIALFFDSKSAVTGGAIGLPVLFCVSVAAAVFGWGTSFNTAHFFGALLPLVAIGAIGGAGFRWFAAR